MNETSQHVHCPPSGSMNEVKSFIRNLLSSQLEDVEKEIDKIDKNWNSNGEYYDNVSKALQEIKEAINNYK